MQCFVFRIFNFIKIRVFFTLLYTSIFSCSIYADDTNGKLIESQGKVLNLYYHNEYKEIKRAEIFYGYGLLGRDRVFLAYQDPTRSEAVAIIEIYNMNTGNTTKLTKLGGVGESHFDVNLITGYVVYNDSDGIHLFIINNDNSFVIHDVLKEVDAWGVFWINTNTVGTMILNNNMEMFKKIKIDFKLHPKG